MSAQPLELREIPGPSAFGGGWRRTWDLLRIISVTEFRAQYTNTLLGYSWSILKPFAFFGVIYLVVSKVKLGGDNEDFPAMLVLGLVLFQYFTEATSTAVRSISAKESLIRKMHFPRIVIPLSVNLSAAISLFFNMLGVFVLFAVAGVTPRPEWLLLPLILVGLVAITTALSMLLSVAYVRAPDTAQAWSLVTRVLFYGTPVLYTLELIPDSIQPAIAVNPIATLISYARNAVIDPAAATPVELVGLTNGLLIPIALSVAIGIAGVWAFVREAPRVAEAL